MLRFLRQRLGVGPASGAFFIGWLMSSTSGKVRTRYIAKGTFFDVPAAGAGEDGKALTWDDLAKTFAYAAYDAEGTAADALAAHIADGDPHAQYLLESAYTAADVLSKLLAVDGASSGLDADLLDGQHASAFAAVSHSHNLTDLADVDITLGAGVDGYSIVYDHDSETFTLANVTSGGGYSDEQAQDAVGTILVDSDTIDFTYADATPSIAAEVKDGSITSTKLADGAALAEILDDDGTGSGLDADLLDGQHASAFAAASHDHTASEVTDFAEAAQDAVGAALVDSDTVDFTYTDATPSIPAIVKSGSITSAHLEDGAALAEILDDDGAGSGLDADLLDGQHASAFAAASHSHTASDVSDFQEAAQDAAAAALTDSDTIDFAYDDSEGEITAEVKDGSITSTKLADGAALAEILDDDGAGSGLDADLLDGQHAAAFAAASHSHTSADVSDFTEAAQDAIGAMLDDSATIALTYTDATPAMVASVIDGSIGNAKLADMAQNTVKGRITASTGAPEDLTATNLITILLTADGASSGLDADLLDGQHASAFAAASHSHTLADLTDVDVALGAGVDGYSLVYDHDTTSFVLASITAYTDEQAQDAIGAMLANSATISFTYTDATPEITAAVIDGSITNAKLADMAQNTVKGRITASTGAPEDLTAANLITILLTADGAGSGLDADLLDGQHASAFAASSHSHATSDITSFTEAVQDIVGALIQDSSQINVTYNDGTGALTLAPQLGGISNIFLAPMTGPSVKGRLSGTGDPQDLTAANVISIITGTGSSWYDAIDSALDSITDTVFGGAFGGNRVRIVNGAIGIGGTSPAANAPLHIKVTAGEGLRIQGSGTTGDNSIAYLTFYDVNGTTRRGYVGDGSTFNDDIYLQADTGAIRLRAGGGSDTLVLDGDDGTLTGALTAQRFITRTDSIADDAVVSFAPNQIIGTIILSSSSFGGSVPGIIHYRAVATATCTKIAGGANLNVTTGVLTGTTGTDGRVTVSCTDSGIVYVENRMGGQMSIRITILG
jgi:hypothetical protein